MLLVKTPTTAAKGGFHTKKKKEQRSKDFISSKITKKQDLYVLITLPLCVNFFRDTLKVEVTLSQLLIFNS